MAVKLLETLVLRGVSVVSDVLVSRKRIGSNPAQERTSANLLSLRHPAQTDADYQPDMPSLVADLGAMNATAHRAGRPAGGTGALPSRSPARNLRDAILFGWPLSAGETGASMNCRSLGKSRPAVQRGQVLRGRTPACRAGRFGQTRRLAALLTEPSHERTAGSTARFIPAGGAHLASTRGKGGR